MRRPVRAVLRACVLLVVTSVVVLAATEALPGDAVDVRTGGRATPEQLTAARAAAGLDRPLPQHYLEWLTGLVSGDPGRSLLTGRPVADIVGERAGTSLALVGAALVLTIPLAVGLAWASARGPRPVRSTARGLTATIAALPQPVVAVGAAALLAGVFGLVPALSLLPAGTPAWQRPDLLVLPVLTLALPSAAYAAGTLSGLVADVVGRPFVRDAVLRGVGPLTVGLRYVGPLVAAPAVRVLAVVSGALVAGTTVAETLFGVAGLGELFVSAIGTRDTPVVQAVAMLAALVVAGGLLVADLLGDPRAGCS